MPVTVQSRMKALGAVWNPRKRTWTVPRERQAELQALLAGLGVDVDLDNLDQGRTGEGRSPKGSP